MNPRIHSTKSEAAPAWLDAADLPVRLARADGTVATTAGWPASRRAGEYDALTARRSAGGSGWDH